MGLIKITIVFILLFLLYSCNKKKIEYYSNGQKSKEYQLVDGNLQGLYIKYNKNGKITVKHLFRDNKLIDSSIFYKNNFISEIQYHSPNDTIYIKLFNKNNSLKSEGNRIGDMRIGKWKYYKDGNVLDKIFEYKNIKGVQYPNQGWYFNEKGNLIEELSNFYKLNTIPNSVRANEVVNLEFTYKPLLNSGSNILVCVGQNINPDFSNLEKIWLDSIYPKSNNFNIKISFSKEGQKSIRGFIDEIYYKVTNSNDTVRNDRFVYFDIPIKVL